ncbi:MAG: septum formation initiator [Bdellovibrionales bacterium CG10_big_fil_rev_8_21_14_0_10_45_34]|nr:MAG: septum formation initiator [Bdellovibrionales bacterium CG10_big_fil_rev_8_21_14_0_10_45_34]
MKTLILFLLAVTNSITLQADPKHLLFEAKTSELKNRNKNQKLSSAKEFLQTLDHLTEGSDTKFSQRYWIDSTRAENSNSPVLFYLCGEGECGPQPFRGAIAKHAEELKAYLVALEHRYYGKSQPFEDLSTENLRFLTVEQVLRDYVNFKKTISSQLQLTGKWYAVGGSYAGSLAAYARLKYPEDFEGALASSGPVKADNNFDEYDRHVAEQAGPACLSAIQSAVHQIEAMVQDPTRNEAIKHRFRASELTNDDDFLYLIADVAAAAIQYGMRDEFCAKVTYDPVTGYIEAAAMVGRLFGNLVDMSAHAAQNTSVAAHSGTIGMRQWFYQSCTTFGFWQNAWSDSAMSARSSRINSEYHKGICKRLFGIEQQAPEEAVNREFYLPLFSASTSNIFFTNGNEDPWVNLSVVDASSSRLNAYVIQNAAHCDDLGSGSNPFVIEAQKMFQSLVQIWNAKK